MATCRFTVPVGADIQLAVDVYTGQNASGPTLVFWPAMGVRAGFYRPFGDKLSAQGFTTLIPDVRGFGESKLKVDRSASFGYHDVATVDFPAVLDAARSRYSGRPLLLGGHSLGGQLAVTFASRSAKEIDGLLLVAASNPYFRAQPPITAAKVLLATTTVSTVAQLYGHWPGDRLGFLGRQSRVMMLDWARLARTGKLRFAGSEDDVEKLLETVELPVLSVSIEGDNYAPAGAVDRLVAPLKAAKVDRWHHVPSAPKMDHFRWVKSSEEIARHIAKWASVLHRT